MLPMEINKPIADPFQDSFFFLLLFLLLLLLLQIAHRVVDKIYLRRRMKIENASQTALLERRKKISEDGEEKKT